MIVHSYFVILSLYFQKISKEERRGKEIEEKNRRKEKIKENKKVDLKLIIYFIYYFKPIKLILTPIDKD